MQARDLMTPDPFTVVPTDSIQRAAEVMANVGVGSLPVVHDEMGKVLVGIITDRDIVLRCVAFGHAGCSVKSHMTLPPLKSVEPDADAAEVVAKMESGKVRRVVVVNSDRKVVGIIAQADIVTKLGPAHPRTVEDVLERISAPVLAP